MSRRTGGGAAPAPRPAAPLARPTSAWLQSPGPVVFTRLFSEDIAAHERACRVIRPDPVAADRPRLLPPRPGRALAACAGRVLHRAARRAVLRRQSYRNDAGDRVALGGKWEERSLLGTVELGWKKRLSVVMAAPFISATRQDGAGSTTSTGLEDFRFGLRYGLHQGPTRAGRRARLAGAAGLQPPVLAVRRLAARRRARSSSRSRCCYGTAARPSAASCSSGPATATATSRSARHRQDTTERTLRGTGVAARRLQVDSTYVLSDPRSPERPRWSNDLGRPRIWASGSRPRCSWAGATRASMTCRTATSTRSAPCTWPARSLVWRVDDRLDLIGGLLVHGDGEERAALRPGLRGRGLQADQAEPAAGLPRRDQGPLTGRPAAGEAVRAAGDPAGLPLRPWSGPARRPGP